MIDIEFLFLLGVCHLQLMELKPLWLHYALCAGYRKTQSNRKKRKIARLSVESSETVGRSIKNLPSESLGKVSDLHDIQSCPFDL